MLARCWLRRGASGICRTVASRRLLSSSAARGESASNSPTAALCIIGDEILNGKTLDINSYFFAKRCFGLGVEVEKIEVVPDKYSAIAGSVQQLSRSHDIVFTSGGIGPTHDDITYSAVAQAFGSKIAYHADTLARMRRIMASRGATTMPDPYGTPEQVATARMALFPADATVVYPCSDYWVPVVCAAGNVHMLPGIPKLFEDLLDAYLPGLVARLSGEAAQAFTRALVGTRQRESAIAPILTRLQERYAPRGVKIGSYPDWIPSRNTPSDVP
ncbi:hypothetical protein GGI02_005245, partial [Coemansia sp. RSA 2322]